MKIRTLRRIDDPQRGGASISADVEITVSANEAKRLIDEGKAEAVKPKKEK